MYRDVCLFLNDLERLEARTVSSCSTTPEAGYLYTFAAHAVVLCVSPRVEI